MNQRYAWAIFFASTAIPVGAARAASTPAAAAATVAKYDLDPAHTQAAFTVKHMMVSKVHGAFRDVTGSGVWDDKDVTKSSVEFTANAASIDTGVTKRDDDLRSANFFDVAKYPKVTFKSTKVEKDGKNIKLTGDLTMHGVTKPLVLMVEGPSAPFKDPFGLTRAALTATGKLNRRDYNLLWDKKIETGGVIVSDEVDVEINAEFVRRDPSKT